MASVLSGLAGAPLAAAVLDLCTREPRDVVLASVESAARESPADPDLAFRGQRRRVAALRARVRAARKARTPREPWQVPSPWSIADRVT